MTTNHLSRAASVRRVLWIVLALNLAVMAIKLAVGLATGALAIVADAFHSLVDTSSNVIGLIGVWLGARPADENHPYGHYKYETMAALAIGGLLLVASFEIGRTVVERLLGETAAPEVTPLILGLMALTFAINWAVSVYEAQAGRRLRSDVLLADATHTRTDLYVTLSVIGSLIGTHYGLKWLDPVVAGAVVLLLFRAAVDILRSTSNVLTDVAIADPDEVRRIALGVPGVSQASGIRSRGRADAGYVDLNVQVHPSMDTDQAHNVATEVEQRITQAMPGILEAVVHVEPRHVRHAATHWEDIAVRLRGIADGLGVGLHDLHVHAEEDSAFSIEMHVEVEAQLSLGAAHALADRFERRARAALPAVRSIVTHIEPLSSALPDEEGDIARQEALRERIISLADEIAGRGACHSVELHNVSGHLTVTLHVTQPADMPLTEAHALAEQIERNLQTHHQTLRRVVVHVEPPD